MPFSYLARPQPPHPQNGCSNKNVSLCDNVGPFLAISKRPNFVHRLIDETNHWAVLVASIFSSLSLRLLIWRLKKYLTILILPLLFTSCSLVNPSIPNELRQMSHMIPNDEWCCSMCSCFLPLRSKIRCNETTLKERCPASSIQNPLIHVYIEVLAVLPACWICCPFWFWCTAASSCFTAAATEWGPSFAAAIRAAEASRPWVSLREMIRTAENLARLYAASTPTPRMRRQMYCTITARPTDSERRAMCVYSFTTRIAAVAEQPIRATTQHVCTQFIVDNPEGSQTSPRSSSY